MPSLWFASLSQGAENGTFDQRAASLSLFRGQHVIQSSPLFGDLKIYFGRRPAMMKWAKACSSHAWVIKSAVDHPEALYWRDHPTRPCCPFGHVSCIGRGPERWTFQISAVIGDKKEGHFKHSSKQLCVYIHHMYIHNVHDTFNYISYCVLLAHLVQMKSIVKVCCRFC